MTCVLLGLCDTALHVSRTKEQLTMHLLSFVVSLRRRCGGGVGVGSGEMVIKTKT